jgi:alcohol dehydrogenase (NADP+)
MPTNIGLATPDQNTPLAPLGFDRPPVGPRDVRIDIAFCGICRSDVHQARDEFGGPLATNYPCMPGHEIVGTVTEVGEEVTAPALGDRVGVGCMVFWGDPADREEREEQYQATPAVFTYNTKDPETGEVTFGGYADEIVVDEHFVLRIPEGMALEQAAPILCAGVTTWSPLRHWGIGAGHRVGVAGIGGLGHMAIQLAKARGAEQVVALTTSPEKAQEALALGADEVLDMCDADAVAEHAASLDFVLSTIPEAFDLKPYVSLVRHDGTLVTVGMLVPSLAEAIDFGALSMRRVSIAGSLIGSIEETQEVLDFCAEHGIAAQVQVIDAGRVNEAFDEVVAKDVRYRYVIDAATLPVPA